LLQLIAIELTELSVRRMVTDLHVLRDCLTNCYCQFLTWRCRQKPSALALLQSGTHCHSTVAWLSSPAHFDEAC